MPKKISIIEKRKWLEEYESGKSLAKIAKDHNRNVRTVRDGIEDARREHEVRLARVDIIKDSIRKHQQTLENELIRIKDSIMEIPKDLAPLSWQRNGDSVFSEPKMLLSEEETKRSTAGRKPKSKEITSADLLRQHLKGNKLWNLLYEWEKGCTEHLSARMNLQRQAIAMLEKKPGYTIIDKGGGTYPFVYSYTAGPLLYQAAVNWAFGLRDLTELEADILVEKERGVVTYHGNILAEAPGNEEACRRSLVEAIEELCRTNEAAQVFRTYEGLSDIAAKVRLAVDAILLLGLIPGRCYVCGQLER